MSAHVEQNTDVEGQEIRVRGLVQGVGFRPTTWRIARECDLAGNVLNDSQGVLIHVWGKRRNLQNFVRRLWEEAPPLSRIDSIECAPLEGLTPRAEFQILESSGGRVGTGIVPDAATCPDCLAEIFEADNRRNRYAFTNCTHCGPRLSIVSAIPYDRANTSMDEFQMCGSCLSEYQDPSDRRFHAQPNACGVCGPRLWLEDKNGEIDVIGGRQDVIAESARLIKQGSIVAVKGIGGFHLACDATNESVVAELRKRKRRYDKPFALMAQDVNMVSRYAEVNVAELNALSAKEAPIVVLNKSENSGLIANSVAPRQISLGFMLPYTPLHHLLMADLSEPIVLTSGNISHESQVISNVDARTKLYEIADYWLMHDRSIVNRLDDSVARVTKGELSLLRRARGYSPAPIELPAGFESSDRILAMGAELKNTFCLVQNGQAIVSQHIGDLEDDTSHRDYRNNMVLYHQLFEFTPDTIAVDMHPDYLSTQWGMGLAQSEDVSLEQVQHHHAHIASCLAENHVPLQTTRVLGIVLDGLGYGDDGKLWGSEFLLADYESYDRIAHFAPQPLIGGEKAMQQPWRNAYAYIAREIGWGNAVEAFSELELIKYLSAKPLPKLEVMIDAGLNSPLSTSAGRLFDGVAAALDVSRDQISYEGQAAIELEALATRAIDQTHCYGFEFIGNKPVVISWGEMWRNILDDLTNGVERSKIAARFHKTFIQAVVRITELLAEEHQFSSVVLSGGVFQNRLLLEGVIEGINRLGLEVLTQKLVPANDGGIALGQAVIAAARRE